jgi:poly(A) polymerase
MVGAWFAAGSAGEGSMPYNVPQIREAVTRCKALLRNGYDAYVVNAPLQKKFILQNLANEVDIACAADVPTLIKIFPTFVESHETGLLGTLAEDGMVFRFYPTDIEHASHPELGLMLITPRMVNLLIKTGQNTKYLNYAPEDQADSLKGFEDPEITGNIQFEGLPSRTLRRNYLLAVRALRVAANRNLPVDPNTWLAIVQAASRVLVYVPLKEIMDEWRRVFAPALHRFVRLLNDAHILHGLMPEIAALNCIREPRNKDSGTPESLFDLTIDGMRVYPQGGWEHDWLGAMAMLFRNVGKLYTGEYDGRWTFYQHHRVGAGVTREILSRLHFPDADTDLICHLVRHSMHFHFMLTDRGLRRFTSLDENSRLIAMCRADIQARGSSTTNFNHNSKYLERARTDEIMLEPLLNGNEIMECLALHPGPMIGMIRDKLLQAQKTGEVTDRESAVAFVRRFEEKKTARSSRIDS